MTIEEKRDALEDYCGRRPCCGDCMFDGKDETCDFSNPKQVSNDRIETYYAELVNHANVAHGENDQVNHPSHYTKGGVECIDAMEAAFGIEIVQHFCVCNAFKYVFRHLNKNGLEDLRKAIWYLNKYLKLEEKKNA